MAYLTPSQRMAIRGRAARMAGDPFLGALLGRVAGAVLPFGAKVVGAIGKKIAGGGGARKVAVAGAAVAGRLARGPLGRAALGGAAFAGGGALVGRMLRGRGAEGKRRRTMRVTNVKALNKAMRRVEGFAKLARRTISFTKQVKMKKCRGRRAA